MTSCQGTEALAFARRKRSSGPFTSGLTPQDRRDDLQLAAAVRAVLQVELEHPFEQLGPAQPHRAVVRTVRLALGGLCFLGCRLGPLWHHQRVQLGVGGQRAVEADQAAPSSGNAAAGSAPSGRASNTTAGCCGRSASATCRVPMTRASPGRRAAWSRKSGGRKA